MPEPFFAFFLPQLLCVHAWRRCHTAITALNDHVGLDNDYPCQRAANTCGTPAFYRCGRMLWKLPQKKNIAPLVIPLLNAHWRVKKNILMPHLHFPTHQTRKGVWISLKSIGTFVNHTCIFILHLKDVKFYGKVKLVGWWTIHTSKCNSWIKYVPWVSPYCDNLRYTVNRVCSHLLQYILQMVFCFST